MTRTTGTDSTPPAKGKGAAFFDRADQLAETANWDYAIEMYVEGIKREPGNIQRGHQPLREVALKRKLQKGRPAGMIESMKRKGGKDPVVAMANAEYLLAKDPGNLQHMVTALLAASKAEQVEVVNWLGDLLLDAQRQAEPKKRNFKILMFLVDAYSEIEEYGKAIQACEMAREFKPDDAGILERLQDLGAKYTIKKGQYGQEGDFKKGVKDFERQKELIQEDAAVKSKDYREQQVEKARAEYLEAPTVPGKIQALVKALTAMEAESYENEAIDVLQKAYDETGTYQYKMGIGDITMRQMKRRYRELLNAGRKDDAIAQARKQLAFELGEFKERAANYPTDLSIKYELGKRLFLSGQYDEAIGVLQQAQREPRRRLMAMNYLAQAFAKQGMLQEASDTYDRILENEMTEEQEKEFRYNLGQVACQMDQLRRAEEQLSKVAQLDYNYKDARKTLEKVRAQLKESGGQASA